MAVCVCLKRENKEMDRKYQSDWKCETKRQSEWRRRRGEHVINLLRGGLRQVSASPLALFTQQAVRGGASCRLLTLKQHRLSEMVNMSLINMYSLMFLVSCVECMRQKMINCNMLFRCFLLTAVRETRHP